MVGLFGRPRQLPRLRLRLKQSGVPRSVEQIVMDALGQGLEGTVVAGPSLVGGGRILVVVISKAAQRSSGDEPRPTTECSLDTHHYD